MYSSGITCYSLDPIRSHEDTAPPSLFLTTSRETFLVSISLFFLLNYPPPSGTKCCRRQHFPSPPPPKPSSFSCAGILCLCGQNWIKWNFVFCLVPLLCSVLFASSDLDDNFFLWSPIAACACPQIGKKHTQKKTRKYGSSGEFGKTFASIPFFSFLVTKFILRRQFYGEEIKHLHVFLLLFYTHTHATDKFAVLW